MVLMNYVNMMNLYFRSRDPAKNSQVTAIDNKTLLCKHDRFMYPLPWQDEEDGEESM